MSTYIETLKKGQNQIVPRTKIKAITDDDGVCLTEILDDKVDKVIGKGLSTNDYDNAAKNKLDAITVPTKTSELTNDSGFLTEHQDITGKADKVASAINGNFAGLDANGNLTDSGKKASDFLDSEDIEYAIFYDDDAVQNGQEAVTQVQLSNKVDKNQGTAKAGQFLVVGSDGNVATMTLSVWQGGSY